MQHTCAESWVLLRPGAIDAMAAQADRLGCARLLLLAGRRTRASPIFARVLDILGSRVAAVFEDVVEHSSTASVAQGAMLARDVSADGLVPVGGGSAVDTAKAIAIVLAEKGRIEDHASYLTPSGELVAPALSQPKPPILAVPTSASAAEVTPGLSVRDESGRKLLFWDTKLAARCIFLDPQANLDVPAELMARTAMNALAHCAEGLYSRTRDPITDALAREGARHLARGLPAMTRTPQSVSARAEILLGAHLSGKVISNARTGIGHAICHCLGALGGLSHGEAHAVMLPHVLRYNSAAAPDALRALAAALQDQPESATRAEAAVPAVQALQHAAGLPTRLRDLGLDRSLLPTIATHTLSERGILFNPAPVPDAQAVLALLEQAW